MKKRIISLALCFLLVFSHVLPVAAVDSSEPACSGSCEDTTSAATHTADCAVYAYYESMSAKGAQHMYENWDAISESDRANLLIWLDAHNPDMAAELRALLTPAAEESTPTETTVPAETTAPAEIEPAVEDTFDVQAAREQVLSVQSEAELEAYLGTLTEEQQAALGEVLTQEELIGLAQRFGYEDPVVSYPVPKNFTDAGPLMPPVRTSRLLFSMARTLQPGNGLNLTKTVTPVEGTDGLYTVTLEAYTTGEVTNITKAIPTDIVLVLDESGTMNTSMYVYEEVYSLDTNETYYIKNGDSYSSVMWCNSFAIFGGRCSGWYTGGHLWFLFHWGAEYEPKTSASDTNTNHDQFYARREITTTKSEALKTAAASFVEKIYDDAVTHNVDHRVGVVTFADSANIDVGLVEDDIRNNHEEVLSAVNSLTPNGASNVAAGLESADTVFANASDETTADQRTRIVILFTNGVPNDGNWATAKTTTVANSAIAASKVLKKTRGATVYAIGMHDDCDPTLDITDKNLEEGSADLVSTNKFMHYVSSNYPEADSMTNPGIGANDGYYLVSNDTASMNAIFNNIFKEMQDQQTSTDMKLDETAVVKDVIAPQFSLSGDVKGVKVYTADSTNGTDFADRVERSDLTTTVNDNTVSVSGFSFVDNFVDDTPRNNNFYGRKLIVEFNITVDSNFLGGNGVETNLSDSGVYNGDTLVEAFVVPPVDIPVKTITPEVQNQNIYLTKTADLSALLTSVNSSISGLNNDYVMVTYSIMEGDSEIGFYSVFANDNNSGWETQDGQNMAPALTADKTYTVVCTVAPVNDGTYENAVASDSASVYVFAPEIVWKDSQLNGGVQADYETQNYVGVVWKHGDTPASEAFPAMSGSEPDLTYEYDVAEAVFSSDQKVSVTVNAGSKDITEYVSFVHESCEFSPCGWTSDDDGVGGCEFIVHIKTFDLTITKSGVDTKDAGAPFVFNVKCVDTGVDMNVVIYGNSSVTIKGLQNGTYTVKEVSGYWRYNLDAASPDREQTATPTNGVATVTFSNSRGIHQWLDDFASATNKFAGSEQTA